MTHTIHFPPVPRLIHKSIQLKLCITSNPFLVKIPTKIFLYLSGSDLSIVFLNCLCPNPRLSTKIRCGCLYLINISLICLYFEQESIKLLAFCVLTDNMCTLFSSLGSHVFLFFPFISVTYTLPTGQ